MGTINTEFLTSSLLHKNINGTDYLMIASQKRDFSGSKYLFLINTSDDSYKKLKITPEELNSGDALVNIYRVPGRVKNYEFLMISEGHSVFFNVEDESTISFSSVTVINAVDTGDVKYIAEDGTPAVSNTNLRPASDDYLKKIIFQGEEFLYFESAYTQFRGNDDAAERGYLLSPDGNTVWDPLKAVKFNLNSADMFPYKNRWGFFVMGSDLYVSYKKGAGPFQHCIAKVDNSDNSGEFLEVEIVNEVVLFQESEDLNPRNADYCEYQGSKIMVTEDRLMLLDTDLSVISYAPIHETRLYDDVYTNYKSWLRKGGLVETKHGLLLFTGSRESVHRIEVTDGVIETQTYPLGFDVGTNSSTKYTRLLYSDYFEIGEKSYLTLNKEENGTYGIVEVGTVGGDEPPVCDHDFTAILAALNELKGDVEEFKRRVVEELIPEMTALVSGAGVLNSDVVVPLDTRGGEVNSLISLDTADLINRLTAIEASIQGLNGKSGEVETLFSDAYATGANGIVSLYDIQEEIKVFLVQAKNIINS